MGDQTARGVSLMQDEQGERRVLLSFEDGGYPAIAEYSFSGELYGTQQNIGFAQPQALATVQDVMINVGSTAANHVDFGDAGVYAPNETQSALWIWRSLACLGMGCNGE